MVAVASLARSFKEAQNLLTPVYLISVLPAVLAQLPGVELGYVTAIFPSVKRCVAHTRPCQWSAELRADRCSGGRYDRLHRCSVARSGTHLQ